MHWDIYSRLSVNPRGEKESCDRQERDSQRAVKDRGDAVAHLGRDDGLSAWKRIRQPDGSWRGLRRPGWDAQMGRIRAGQTSGLQIWRLDRMMRQPRDLEDLIDEGQPHGLLLADTERVYNLRNYGDREYLRGRIASACAYSDAVSDKVQRALADAAEQGRAHGGKRPFGYTRAEGGRLVVDEAEAAVTREIFSLFLAGRSVLAIARQMQARPGGVPTAMGGGWSDGSVRSVLRSRAVAGIRAHRRWVTPGGGESAHWVEDLSEASWEPIVAREVWEEVQARLGERSRTNGPNVDRYLLSGLVWCAVCRQRMHTLPPAARHNARYRCEKRPPEPGCGGVHVMAARLDEVLAVPLATIVADPESRRPGETADPDREAALRKRNAALEKLAEIAEDYGADRISREERDASRLMPAARLEEAERVLSARRPPRVDLITGGKLWPELDGWQRRAVARAYIDRVWVGPASRPYNRFDARRVRAVDWR